MPPTHASPTRSRRSSGTTSLLPIRRCTRRLAAAGAPLNADLQALATDAGSTEVAEAVRLADTNTPVLRTHDRAGIRIDEVDYHPAWHTLMSRAVSAGLQAAPWAPDAGTGAHLKRAAGFYLWTQTESGHLCPISMTYAASPDSPAQPGAGPAVRARAPLPNLRFRTAPAVVEGGPAGRHVDDGEAGWIRSPRRQHPRGAGWQTTISTG